jgi:hypothetical protein
VAANINAIGNVTIDATESLTTGDNITVNSGVTINATGDILLNAGDNILIQATSVLNAGKLLQLHAAHNDNDTVNVGATISINGILNGKLIDIETGEFADAITIGVTGSTNGIMVIEGQGGGDAITNSGTRTVTTPVIIFGDTGTFVYDATANVVTSATTTASGVR